MSKTRHASSDFLRCGTQSVRARPGEGWAQAATACADKSAGHYARRTSRTMPGIQISGLLANSAFDWKSVVDQLIAVEAIPITRLGQQKDLNTQKIAALETLKASLVDLQDSLQSMRTDDVFSARTVSSSLANTTWRSSSVTGSAVGSYSINVSQLATAAKLQGTAGLASGLSATSDVSGVTLATMRTATAVTAGTFSVDGAQVTVALTDSLQDVFDKIALAAPGVTASYDETADAVTLTRSSGELVVGAANDTSNFLTVMKLANNGGSSTTSASSLGTLAIASPLASAGLGAGITAVDVSGNGSFTVNGVAISYNVNTDTLGRVLSRINAAGAGVTATYDSANDRVVLTNNTTGDTGVAVSETSGGLLDALGLSASAGGSLAHGQNAQFRVNGGALISSSTNTLEASAHGITGLSVTVNAESTQTLQIESDTTVMSAAIATFIEKFNAVQDYIDSNTKVTVTGGSVSTSLLSENREIQEWARSLQRLAFDAVTGGTGSVTRLDRLGIDFNSTTGKLAVKNSGKLAAALSDQPEDVSRFFLKASTGFVAKMYGYMTNIVASNRSQQSTLGKANTGLDAQMATLQSRLESQRELLTSSFIRMLGAQSSAQSQTSYLTNAFFKNNSSG